LVLAPSATDEYDESVFVPSVSYKIVLVASLLFDWELGLTNYSLPPHKFSSAHPTDLDFC
jgi:hypothetical protein